MDLMRIPTPVANLPSSFNLFSPLKYHVHFSLIYFWFLFIFVSEAKSVSIFSSFAKVSISSLAADLFIPWTFKAHVLSVSSYLIFGVLQLRGSWAEASEELRLSFLAKSLLMDLWLSRFSLFCWSNTSFVLHFLVDLRACGWIRMN